jgi:hypothetical protein
MSLSFVSSSWLSLIEHATVKSAQVRSREIDMAIYDNVKATFGEKHMHFHTWMIAVV